MKTLNFFIIVGESNDSKSILASLKEWEGLFAKANQSISIFTSSQAFLDFVQFLIPKTDFRIWMHLGYKGKDNNSFTPVGILNAQEILEKGLKINYFTRADNLESVQKTIKKHIPNFNEKVFLIKDIGIKKLDIPEVSVSTWLPENISKDEVLNNIQVVDAEPNDIDYLVITAIPAEEEPLLRIFENKVDNSNNFMSGKDLKLRSFKTNKENNKIIAFVNQEKMGMVDAAILTTQAIEILKPKNVIMTGVCGGKKDCNYGDVIIPAQTFTFQFGKLKGSSPDDIKFLPSIYTSSAGNINHVKSLFSGNNPTALKEIKKDIRNDEILLDSINKYNTDIVSQMKVYEKLNDLENKSKLESKKIENQDFKVVVDGDMACSTSVIDVADYFDREIKERVSRDTDALDMESYGVMRACHLNLKPVKCYIIKSIMDKTEGKNDTYKEFAANTSAYTFKYLVYEEII